jgi:[CysO sulfur-carrier protein]-S-L-cysteine hydrolase
MKVPRAIYDEMLEHAREEAPNECCGILSGKDGEATTLYRATNAEASPLRYRIADQDLFDIHHEIEEKGEVLVAIYHSHTASPARPSQTDINLAFLKVGGDGEAERMLAWPGAVYVIVSLVDGETPVRGFDISQDARVSEVELTVE